MAAEDVWIRQARMRVTRTRRLELLLRLEAMIMLGGWSDDEICRGEEEEM